MSFIFEIGRSVCNDKEVVVIVTYANEAQNVYPPQKGANKPNYWDFDLLFSNAFSTTFTLVIKPEGGGVGTHCMVVEYMAPCLLACIFWNFGL